MKGRKKHRVLLQNKEIIINEILKGYLLDISEGGVYIHTQAELLKGVVLDLAFMVDGTVIRVKGVVQHMQEGVGIGLKFLNLSVDDFGRVKTFLAGQNHVVADGRGVRRILLVDDSVQSRSLYRNRLLGDGFQAVEAANGTEAVKRLQEAHYDLVILEIWMEGLDGFKILQLMKIHPVLRDIPVIVLSSRCTPVDQDKALSLGAREYLVKMVTSPVKLSERILHILGPAPRIQ